MGGLSSTLLGSGVIQSDDEGKCHLGGRESNLTPTFSPGRTDRLRHAPLQRHQSTFPLLTTWDGPVVGQALHSLMEHPQLLWQASQGSMGTWTTWEGLAC